MNSENVPKKQKGRDKMPKICFKCGTCHVVGTLCAKKKTLKQISKEFHRERVKLFRELDRAEKESRKHPKNIRYGVKDE